MAIETQHYRAIDISHTRPIGNGKVEAQIDDTNFSAEIQTDPAPGTGIVAGREAAPCGSEIAGGGYYGKELDPERHLSRYLIDREDSHKTTLALQRLAAAGFIPDPDGLIPLLTHTAFHEGVVENLKIHPDKESKPIPIPFYTSRIDGGKMVGMEKVPFYTSFQDGFEEGGYSILNPAIICRDHSNESLHKEVVKKTGWTPQCNRSTHDGHEPKATRGHVEAIGTAISGVMPAVLETLTPLTPALNKYINGDHRNMFVALNTEPMGCVFHAHGPLLAHNNIPETIVVVGDGSNTLNMLAFYQAFAPQSKIFVMGKNPKKLEALQQINPSQITTVVSQGRGDYAELDYALQNLTGQKQADLVVPMVGLSAEDVAQRTKQGGHAIWWAASVSEHSSGFMEQKDGITHIQPYGGAPHTEFSAVQLFDDLLKYRPEVIEAYRNFPAVTYVPMGKEAAAITETWMNQGGRYVDPQTGLSSKPVYIM